jgi:hypothetical protein
MRFLALSVSISLASWPASGSVEAVNIAFYDCHSTYTL